ncbi:MAG: hypothetical protein WD771_06150 [Gemmatimonadaceae bacterium]
MDRRIALTLFSLASLATLAAVRPRVVEERQGQPQNHQILVEIICRADGGATTTITPWQQRVKQDDTVDWALTEASNVAEFEIRKKQFSWLFSDAPPYRGRPGHAARAERMKGNQSGKKFSYSVNATCPNADGTSSNIVIDPDIIVD